MITSVECVEYSGEIAVPEGFFADRLRRPSDHYPASKAQGPQVFPAPRPGYITTSSIALHIRTDDGLVGTTMHISPESAFGVALLRPHLVGADELAIEYLWDLLYRSSIHGRRGIGMVTLSAIDCALWDLRGQILNLPAHRLLGGPTRDTAPLYASTLGESLAPENVTKRSKELVAQGFSGVKWFPRSGPEDGNDGVAAVMSLVAAARAGAGPHADVMLDAWSSWDVDFTVRVANACADLGLTWIEEPLLADDLAGYRTLRRRLPSQVQVAGGEHEYTRWGYQQLLDTNAVDLLQPDPHWSGGISETWKILSLISSAGRPAIFHGQSLQCNAALTFAASPALVPAMEYLVQLMPLYQHFLANPIVPADGKLCAPTHVGLGMTLNPNTIDRQRTLHPSS